MSPQTKYKLGDIFNPRTFPGWCEHDKVYIPYEKSSFNRQYIKCSLCNYRCLFDAKNAFHAAAVVKTDGRLKTTWTFYPDAVSMVKTEYIFYKTRTLGTKAYERKTRQFSLDDMNGFIDKLGILI